MRKPIRRALVSVFDKTDLIELGNELAKSGVEIVSTGSTAAKLLDAGITVTPVEKVTGFPECLDGRVKTLHPNIHGAILADLRKESHWEWLHKLGLQPFDLIVCNLYPFSETVESGAEFDDCVEMIDIGGPTMVRAGAKNFANVAVVTSPTQYGDIFTALQLGGTTEKDRAELARDAFVAIEQYDRQISEWFVAQLGDSQGCCGGSCSCSAGQETPARTCHKPKNDVDNLPEEYFGWVKKHDLRYGENPHQKAGVYIRSEEAQNGQGIGQAIQLSGKEMSYNNYVDADAALRAVYDQPEQPCVAVIKHANPCGIAVGQTISEAHRKAHACDPVSAYGGVIAANREVDLEMATQVRPIFTEVILAPSYSPEALALLEEKKNLRILQITPPSRGQLEIKQVTGGLLVQEKDDVNDVGDDPKNWQLVSGQPADDETMADLLFAWRAVRSVKSNSILLAKNQGSVGVGMGQVNRVDSAKLAVERANTLGKVAKDGETQADFAGGARQSDLVSTQPDKRSVGAVGASDAFFPFADGLEVLIEAGVKAVVQPGGSIRDEEVIEAAKKAGITMYFTSTRHFFH